MVSDASDSIQSHLKIFLDSMFLFFISHQVIYNMLFKLMCLFCFSPPIWFLFSFLGKKGFQLISGCEV